MYHSIFIGDKNTWTDWHLIPSSRPLIAPPKVKTAYVEIPGGDGSLDLTEAMAGRPLYQNRTGSWEFYVDNEKPEQWYELYSIIMNYCHGQRLKVVLEDDVQYYYEGRLSVNSWKSDPGFSKITIDYTLDPFKKWNEDIKWDDFNFLTDNMYDYSDLPVRPSISVPMIVLDGDREWLSVYSTSSDLWLAFKGKNYEVKKGNNSYKDKFKLDSGENLIVFNKKTTAPGTPHVTLKLEGGRL